MAHRMSLFLNLQPWFPTIHAYQTHQAPRQRPRLQAWRNLTSMALSSPNLMSSTRSQGMRQTDAKTSLLVRKEKQHTHKMPEPPVHTDQPLAVPACSPAHSPHTTPALPTPSLGLGPPAAQARAAPDAWPPGWRLQDLPSLFPLTPTEDFHLDMASTCKTTPLVFRLLKKKR